MIQVGRGLCFLAEPPFIRVAHQGLSQEHLDGDKPVQTALVGAKDDAHPTTGNFTEQLVITDIADLGACRIVRRAVPRFGCATLVNGKGHPRFVGRWRRAARGVLIRLRDRPERLGEPE